MSYNKKLKSAPLLASVMLAGLLIPASAGLSSNAYAAGNGYGSDDNPSHGHDNNQNSTSNNATDDHHGNQTSSEDRGDNQTGSSNDGRHENQTSDDDSVKGHGQTVAERMHNYVNETAESRHREHVHLNAPISGPYVANLNYTIDASGNATSISDNSTTENASLTLDLSVWKSTHGVVSMDIMNGTIKIGNNQTNIYSGHAYYLVNKPRLLVYGFIVDNGAGTSGNSTESSQSVKLVKLFMTCDNGTLPASSSDPSMNVTVQSPQSKVASEWFLDMDGTAKLS